MTHKYKTIQQIKPPRKIAEYRTCFMSDLHLGSRGCKANALIDFINHHKFQKLYLLGDVIDGWRLKKNKYWPQRHNDVVSKILKRTRKNTQIIYIPGNHDEFLFKFMGQFGDLQIREFDEFTTHEGRRLLLLHGHQFDCIMKYAKWMAHLGEVGYNMIVAINNAYNQARRHFGWQYQSISNIFKFKVKQAVNFMSNYEENILDYAKMKGYDGVICGHVHHPDYRRREDGIIYLNCGDFVENCTAIVEDYEGNLSIIHWPWQNASEQQLTMTEDETEKLQIMV